MKIKTEYCRWLIAVAATLLCSQISFSAEQAYENFDGSEWPTVTGNPPNSTNAITMTTNGWTITRAAVGTGAGATSSTNCLWIFRNNTNIISSLQSPFLSNGVGTVTFDYRNTAAGTNFNILIKTYDGSTWITNGTITNAATSFAGYTNAINLYNAQRVAIERYDTSSGQTAIDTVRITYPTPVVTISNVFTIPTRPTDQDTVTIAANVGIQSVAETFAMTNYWREWPTTNWTLSVMTSNTPSLYSASNAVTGKSIGALVQYFARASFAGNNVTNTADSTTNNYVVTPKSSYTNLSVTGQLAAPLRNGANYQWQGVIQVTNINPTFTFQGVSNGVTTTWGEANQSVMNIPLYGQAEVTASNITLYTINPGYYLFAFNETNRDYSVRTCTYENFNTWTNADSFTPPHTNSAGWVLYSANTSNDATRILEGTGRSAIVETNGWIQTPYLSNGVGQISFWYRNGPTNGSPAGRFQVLLSSNATDWTTIARSVVSNIITTNYLFFSTTTNDLVSRYVRIQNTQTASTARLCFDEVVVSQPGAGINSSNTTPAGVTILDPITLSVNLTPYNGAVISNVTAWYRIGSSGAWETASMTSTDGFNYALSTPIVGAPTNVEFAIQCFYSGFLVANSPLFFPSGGTNSPWVVTVNPPSDNRYQPFDGSEWPTVTGNPPTSSLTTNLTTNGWTITRAAVGTGAGATSSTNCLWIFRNNTNIVSSFQSPYLSNGVGTVTFDYRNTASPPTNIVLAVAIYDGIIWTTNDTITNATATFAGYTNAINLYDAKQVLIQRIDANPGQTAIDTVRITYPPANVAITNVFINPGYPVAGQVFTASCDVVTLNPFYPAYNIAPQFIYWPTNGTLTTGTMSRAWISGTTNHFTLAVALPAASRDTLYSYFVKASFDGYYGSATENQSPKTSETISFTVREYTAAFSNLTTLVNTTNDTARLVSDRIWQSVVNITNSALTFSFQGQGYFTNNSYLTNLWTFGNSNAWQTAIPLSDMATTGQPPVSIGVTNGQYVIRFDESTGQYLVNSCVFQDFDKPGEGNGDVYKRTQVSSTIGGASQNFDYWATNSIRIRSQDFTEWTPFDSWTNGVGFSTNAFLIYSGRVVNAKGIQTYPNVPTYPGNLDCSFVVQPSHFGTIPLRGIGEISYTYAAESTNTSKSLYTYLAPTNNYIFTNSTDPYFEFKTQSSYWKGSTPVIQTDNITNLTFMTTNFFVATNLTMDIVLSQISAGTNQSVFIKSASVSEWYSEPLTTNADGWVGSGYYITQNGRTPGNCCLLDSTRTTNPTNQYIRTPIINSGVKYLEFYYAGSSFLTESTNVAISFTVEQGSGNPISWTNMVTISTNYTPLTRTTFNYFSTNLNISTAGIYFRIRNTSPRPNALLLDRINIPGYATTNSWSLNNAAPDYDEQQYPPLPRQYYRGVCYLNNTTNQYMETGTNAPDISRPAYIRSPYLDGGIGEISFRYRNWSTNGMAVTPGKIVVQAAAEDRYESDWAAAVTVATISNIVNTNTYAFFQTALYDETNRYVRIYNYNPLTDPTSSVGRVCIDEVLVSAPMAAKVSLSNLVITPNIPLYTNSVDVSVDVYNLFLNPTIVGMTACYATATSYAGLSSATYTSIPMACVTSSIVGSRQWYRYRTAPSSIPAQPSDTFVKYYAKAAYTGYMAAVTSPRTNAAFGLYPSWLAPLDTQNGTNLAYYVVYSCPTGSVWINEINPVGYTAAATNQEFIEICGSQGIDLSGWYIDDILPSLTTQAVYQIVNGTIISNMSNGFGFWVIGGNAVANRDMLLTQKIGYPAGIRLRRPTGIYEHAVCFGDTLGACGDLPINGFTYIGKDVSISYRVLSATGTGTLANAFTSWVNTFTNTARSVNFNQFVGEVSLWSPTISILGFQVGTNIWIMCTSTNNWHPVPWSTTNLMASNSWSSIASSNYTSIETSSNCVLNIQKATNNSPYFYKIVATNSP